MVSGESSVEEVGEWLASELGDTIPDVTLDKPTGELGFPPEKISLRGYTAGRKVILMGLPGAFTPT